MQQVGSRVQRTITRAVEVSGTGFLTGARVTIRFIPAPPSTGIVFVRRDLTGSPQLSANVKLVTDTRRRTTLGTSPIQVTLVEHTLAALAGLRIDNCYVELNAVEPPGLDGSAYAFVEALLKAGIVPQSVPRPIWGVSEPLTVRADQATLTLHPPEPQVATSELGLTLGYFLDYGSSSPIIRQLHHDRLTPGSFAKGIADCRTFLLAAEADVLRRQGLGSRTTPADLLVFGATGPIDNTLRYANEPARHKVLDMIGDLSLLGVDLCGRLIAYRSGHPLNVELTRILHDRLVAALTDRECSSKKSQDQMVAA